MSSPSRPSRSCLSPLSFASKPATPLLAPRIPQPARNHDSHAAGRFSARRLFARTAGHSALSDNAALPLNGCRRPTSSFSQPSFSRPSTRARSPSLDRAPTTPPLKEHVIPRSPPVPVVAPHHSKRSPGSAHRPSVLPPPPFSFPVPTSHPHTARARAPTHSSPPHSFDCMQYSHFW